jgi:alkylation response protein AidB-like acyl-CoA dehydrogenase
MDFDLSEDQRAIQDAVQRILAPLASGRHTAQRHIDGSEIELALKAAGFYEIARSGSGELDAILVVEVVAMHAASAEFGMTAVAGAILDIDLTPPTAVTIAAGEVPIRFLSRGRNLICLMGSEGWLLDIDQTQIRPVGDACGYPFGILPSSAFPGGRRLLASQAVGLQRAWRLVLAAEILGAAQAALDMTVGHVRERRQFGRAIGSFQAIQHRLAEIATAVESLRLMTYRAALSREGSEAALALGFGQELAARVSYDCHQFHGALGQSLEYPLHYFTDRLRALQGECGGYPAQYFTVAGDWKSLEGLY